MRNFKPIWEPIPVKQQAWREKAQGRRLVIEIGPGVGLHPVQYAQQNPNDFIIGIERTTEKFNKFARRAANHAHLTNLYPIHADAVEWISQNILAGEVGAYFLLYPNPYPKAAQKNKRLMHMPFMQYLITTMQAGATLTMATNMEFFYQEAKQQWLQEPKFELVSDCLITLETQPIGRTHFERKYLADGQVCYELVFRKVTATT